MTDQDIVFAIKYLLPDAEFSFTDNDLDSIIWKHPKTGYPTKEQIIAAIEPAKADMATREATKADQKAALLERLGITADEAALLLS
jgi:hypothetical protein